MQEFPRTRLRRLRLTPGIRQLTQETSLDPGDFVYPMFLTHGVGIKKPIEPMPGIYHFSIDMALDEASEVAALGIPAILLFGLPDSKDSIGSEAYDPQGIIQQGIRAIKKRVPELVVITDTCLCEYTDHGHCGILGQDGNVENDPTLDLLARTALSHAEAGADIVAPSAMMDGQVQAIRKILDSYGHVDVAIMAYAAKYASAFYGPFRIAAESAPQSGNRRGYQMDPTAWRQALLELEQDLAEGADILMVKPALAFLDILARAREKFYIPLAAYNVSGEYSMVKAAGEREWLNDRQVALEILTSIKRAGANMIITYHAKEAAKWLREEN